MLLHLRANLALTILLTAWAVLPGCAPADEGVKRERDASVEPPPPPPDREMLLEAFCVNGDGTPCACYGNTCDRICGPGECQGVEIICPPDQDCIIFCEGEGACAGLHLDCEASETDCGISCKDGACEGLQYECDDVFGVNCCSCIDESDAFKCPRRTGPTSCDPPSDTTARSLGGRE